MRRETIDGDILKTLKQSRQPVSTREIALKISRAWHTTDRHCLKLQLAGRIHGFRLSNINVWQVSSNSDVPMRSKGAMKEGIR